jgi:hypothetical protein
LQQLNFYERLLIFLPLARHCIQLKRQFSVNIVEKEKKYKIFGIRGERMVTRERYYVKRRHKKLWRNGSRYITVDFATAASLNDVYKTQQICHKMILFHNYSMIKDESKMFV